MFDSPLNLFIAFVVFASSVWVAVDAASLGAKPGKVPGLMDMGPGGWFVACLALWALAFPIYLGHRSMLKQLRHGAPCIVRWTDGRDYQAQIVDVTAQAILVTFGGATVWVPRVAVRLLG